MENIKLRDTTSRAALFITVAVLLVASAAYGEFPTEGMSPAAEQSTNTQLIIQTYGQEYHSRKSLIVDDYEGSEIENRLGGRANIYVQNPSRVMVSRASLPYHGRPSTALMLTYEKDNEGGPYDGGGWCGYYTLLKRMRHGEEDIYFDASAFSQIVFRVKGETGQENFVVGMSDRHWDKVGDGLKSGEIGSYLESGHITTDWQWARVPMDEFFLDHTKLSSISIGFEAACFPDGSGKGTVYIDDLALEK